MRNQGINQKPLNHHLHNHEPIEPKPENPIPHNVRVHQDPIDEDRHHEHHMVNQHDEEPALPEHHDEEDSHEDKDEEPNKTLRNDIQPVKGEPADAAAVALDGSTKLVLAKHGTGPTKVGFVVDLVQERSDPTFRKEPALVNHHYLETFESVVAKELDDVEAVHACEILQDGSLQIDPKCHDEDTRLVAYNTADFTRHVCGKALGPNRAMVLDGDGCHTWVGLPHDPEKAIVQPPLHLLPQDNPPVSGHGMPPIQIISKPSAETPTMPTMESITCDIPCEWEKDISGLDRYVVGTSWRLVQTDKDPSTERRANMERTDFRHDKYYSTTSWKSDVPLSFYSFEKYNLRNAPAIDFDAATNAASSVVNSDCASNPVRRQKWLASAQAHVKNTHFYGSCNHNTEIPEGSTIDTTEGRIDLMKKDRMVLAYETGTEKYHVTEIVWEALMSGAVPAILGASNLEKEILPPHSALYATNFQNWDPFSELIQQVSDSKEQWESYHEWRKDEAALTAFETRMNFTRTSPQCRTCRWAYAKKYGLGWDHVQQRVQDNAIPKHFCLSSDDKYIAEPFVEAWYKTGTSFDTEKTASASECHEQTSQVSIDALGIHRFVWNHDGMTDMKIHMGSTTEMATLRITVNVNNQEGAIFRNVHTLAPDTKRFMHVSSAAIQDRHAKVVLLANWPTTAIRSPGAGLLEIDVSAKDTAMWGELQIRIFTEDFNVLHDKLTEYYPSSFGKMAMKDFIDPLELFYVSS